MTDLPESWEQVEIVEVLAKTENGKPFQQGWSPQCEAYPADPDGWGVLKTTAIQHGEFRDHENKALPVDLDPRPQIEVAAGDVLMTCAGPRNRCGVACLVEHTRPRLMMSGKMYRFRPHPEALHPKYLAYLIQRRETQLQIDLMKTGISDSGLNLTHDRFGQLGVPLAPLPEQHRIVAKIEALFSELDKAVESLSLARAQLKTYRQALLKHAFEGKLTADWRAANADELRSREDLLSRIQQERQLLYLEALRYWKNEYDEWLVGDRIRDRPARPKKPASIVAGEYDLALAPKTPESWNIEHLGNLAVEVSDGPFGSNLKTSDYVESGVRVVRLENIGHGRFIDTKRSYISEEKYEALKRHTVKPNDIVFSSFVTDSIRSAIVPSTVDFAVNKADCFMVRLKGKSVRTDYLQYFLESRNAFKQIEAMIHGVGRPRINTTQLKELKVPICAPEEQAEIVGRLERILSELSAFEVDTEVRLEHSHALRQSILKQAFFGQLVAQDPADEPASALLTRLRGTAPVLKSRRKKTA